MSIDIERDNGTVVARPSGRIDSSNSRDFQSGLEAAVTDSDTVLVLSFENVDYISSAGMRVILLTARSLQRKRAKIALCSMNDSIRAVFKISGFDKIVPIHESTAAALSALSA